MKGVSGLVTTTDTLSASVDRETTTMSSAGVSAVVDAENIENDLSIDQLLTLTRK